MREWTNVRDEARRTGKSVRKVNAAELCHVNHSELPEDDPRRIHKGRVILLGDHIINEYYQWAEYKAQATSTSSLAAGASLDVCAVLPGYVDESADARKAFCQEYYAGKDKLYVSLPRDRWLPEWEEMTNPVVPLVLNLYGVTEAGELCHNGFKGRILACNWELISEDEWQDIYYHPEQHAFLEKYVDYFKMAAPESVIGELWAALRKHIMLGQAERNAGF